MKSLSESLQGMMKNRNVASSVDQIVRRVHADPDVQAFLEENRDQITPEMVKSAQSKLYEFYHEKQLREKGMATVAPGYTPQLILNSGQIDVTYVPTKQLIERERQRHIKRLVRSIHMPKFIQNASLDDFYIDDEHQTATRMAALKAAVEFTESYPSEQFMPGLYLYGNFGVGKTYLLGAIANELAKKKGVATTMLHFPSFAVEMRNSIRDNSASQKLEAVKKAPVLMLDDIGADAMSKWVRDDVLGIILEYRMQEELPTFFSSNFSMDELEKNHLAVDNQGDHEPLKAQRIMERVKFLSREMTMTGENMRPK
ncbi:MAG: primosomal protein DnaI [Limosilactobacillus sp.]|uniref:primosomal protein DnaI n=1 Tax=Limosilactobacillus sp. TaxID=2773925 RepID=UPI00270DABE0|nr:primosomal protein DnaI [Limosilactobacillus sp.]